MSITRLLLLIILSNGCISKQIQTKNNSFEKLSNNNSLNEKEVELLNSLLGITTDIYNFEGKKVAFITGSSGSHILHKSDFFETCINPWTAENKNPPIFIVQLNEKEKIKSGGYDVLVLAWVKVFTKKEKVIKLLGNS